MILYRECSKVAASFAAAMILLVALPLIVTFLMSIAGLRVLAMLVDRLDQ